MLVPVPRLAPFLLLRCVRGGPLSYTTSTSDQGADQIDFPDLEITFLTFLSIPLYVHGIIIHVTDYLVPEKGDVGLQMQYTGRHGHVFSFSIDAC
jgi:hypothetical protein